MENTNDKTLEIEGIKVAPAAGAAPSIKQDDAFIGLLLEFARCIQAGKSNVRATDKLVAHIDQHVADAVADGYARGQVEAAIAFGKEQGHQRAQAAIRAATAPVSEAGQAQGCKKCGDTGSVDSGGFTPWGEGIDIPCECATQPAAMDEAAERARFMKYFRDRHNIPKSVPDAMCLDTRHAQEAQAAYLARAALAAPAAIAPQAAELPALPVPHNSFTLQFGGSLDLFTTAQMEAYARAALAMRQPQGDYEYEVVGAAHPVVGTKNGFTRCTFTAVAVPSGAVLFIRKEVAAKQAGKEGAA